jgi:hypothetical protein
VATDTNEFAFQPAELLRVGEARTFMGQHGWLAEHRAEVLLLNDPERIALMTDFISARPTCGSRTSERTQPP